MDTKTPDQLLLQRLSRYANLAPLIKGKRIRTSLKTGYAIYWHPFFTDSPPNVLQDLDRWVGALQSHRVPHIPDVVKRLMANTPDNYLSAHDELMQASKLVERGGYSVEFIKTQKGKRTADLLVHLSLGDVCVELTASNRTWEFSYMRSLFEDKLSGVNDRYRVEIQAWSEALALEDSQRQHLLSQVSNYMARGPYPIASGSVSFTETNHDNQVIAQVNVSQTGQPDYTISYGAVGHGDDGEAFFQPHFGGLVEEIFYRLYGDPQEPGSGKKDQIASCNRGVIVINLTHDTELRQIALNLNVGGLREHLSTAIAGRGLPHEVDALVLMLGSERGLVMRNSGTKAAWTQTKEAGEFLDLLGSARSPIIRSP